MFYYTVLFFIPYTIFLVYRFLSPESTHQFGKLDKTISLFLLEGTGIGTLVATLGFQWKWPYWKYYFNLVPFIALGFVFFILSVAVIYRQLILNKNSANVRKRFAFLLFPFCVFLLFPIKLWLPIPQYGHLILLISVLGLLYALWKVHGSFVRDRFHTRKIKYTVSRFLPVFPFLLGVAIVVILIKRLVFSGTIAGKGRHIAEIRHFSPHFGNFFQRANCFSEKMLYLGFFVLLIMALCLFLLIIKRNMKEDTNHLLGQARFWFVTFLFFSFLSLGFSVPYIPLYALFYKIIPFFKYPRVPGRMVFISYAAMAFCVAWTVEHFDAKKLWINKTILIILPFGILIDYYPPHPLGLCLLNRGRTVYSHLEKKNMPPETVLELPIWPGDTAWSSIYQYYVTRYRYPMINGYSPAVSKDYVQNVFYKLYPMDVGTIPDTSLKMLKRLHVKYITFHANAYPFKISPFPSWFILKRLKAQGGLEQICHTPYITLFKLKENINQTSSHLHLNSITSPIGVLWEAEQCHHFIGKVKTDPSASGGKVVSTLGAQQGLMMGFQYRMFPPGFYDGIIRIKKIGEYTKKALIGVIQIKGFHKNSLIFTKKILGKDLPNDSFQNIRFSFYLPFAKRIECVVDSYGVVPLSLDYAFLSFHKRGEGPAVFQAENLFHQGKITPLPDNPKMAGVCYTPDILNDRAIHGPFHSLRRGKYRISFWMEIGKHLKLRQPVAEIRVERGKPGEILARRTLYEKDWDHKEKLQPFQLIVTLKRPSIVEFPVYYQGIDTLWINRISVDRLE